MITKLRIYETKGTDPDTNLALEEHLLFSTEPGECVLYLWQNQHTVVIGKNQNCWKECDVTLLSEEEGHLARRLSGGGAVYHDLGNLNFTFLVRKEDYDLKRQFGVIARAVEAFGVPVEKSGRNDLLVKGRKFSGNAFYESGDFCYHHGTLLVDVDTEKMSRYLTVSKEKLHSKGVDSVRSRVGNLNVLCPEITVETLAESMKKAFSSVYGVQAEECSVEDCLKKAQELREKYASWDWKYGRKIPFTHSVSGRFPWGGVELELQVDGGIIQKAVLYSDSLDTTLGGLAGELEGCPYEREALCTRVKSSCLLSEEVGRDLEILLREKI